MITSVRNHKIKWVRDLQAHSRVRHQHGLFVVEGVRLAEEALSAGWQVELVLFTQGLSQRGQQLLKSFAERQIPIEEVAPHVMSAASDTSSPQGILLVLEMRQFVFPQVLDFLLIADGVHDPGNLGTLMRTASAAGVDALILPPDTVDPYSPKVVRAAMGAHFHLSLHSMGWEQIAEYLASHNLHLYLSDSAAGQVYTTADFCKPLALVVGSEAQGISVEAHDLAHTCVHIPMSGRVESLNAAIAAGILLFEVVRQRTQGSLI